MQHTLFHRQPQLSPQLLTFLEQLVEWAIAILLLTAAFPLLKEAAMYILMKLYEVFIQYQYLY